MSQQNLIVQYHSYKQQTDRLVLPQLTSDNLPQHWKVEPLSNIALKMKAGGTPKRGEADFWGGVIPFLKIEDITASNGFISTTKECITEKGLNNSNAWLVPA